MALSTFYGRWTSGSLGRSAAKLFAVGRAVLIPKASGNGLRPLGIGEAWYRLGMQFAVRRVRYHIADSLKPIQLGTGFPSGVEICARMVQLALDCDEGGGGRDVCVFSLDIKNAFNSVRRSHILAGIRKFCPGLEPLFRLFYEGETELRFSDGAFACLSQTGVRQGDPLAMLLFALGFWEALSELHTEHQRVLELHQQGYGEGAPGRPVGHFAAYADDVTGSLPAAALEEFLKSAVRIMAKYDLILVPEKCLVHGRLAAPITTHGFHIQPDGLKKVLGCPVGRPEFRAQQLRHSLAEMTAVLPTLLGMGRQSAFVLLAKCVNQRAQYLARVLEGADIREQFHAFDASITQALARILDTPNDGTGALGDMRALPQRKGGLGIYPHSSFDGEFGRNQSRLATKCFIESHYRFLHHQARSSWTPLALGYGGETSFYTLSDKEASRFLEESRVEVFDRVLASLRSQCPARAAWLLSSCTSDSGRWLYYCGGIARRFRMSDDCYVDAVRRRCLLQLSPGEAAVAEHGCECGAHLRRHVTHLLDCPRNQYYFQQRHHTACTLLKALLQRVFPGAIIQQEVPLLMGPERSAQVSDGVPDGNAMSGTGAAEESKSEAVDEDRVTAARRHRGTGQMRADIVVITGASKYTIDVSYVNPSCYSYLQRGTDRVADRASQLREEEKKAKYGWLAGMGEGGNEGFTPFVVEATGRLGQAAMAFIKAVVPKDETFILSQFYGSMSAMGALYNSLMLKGAKRKLGELEWVEL
jgi:hypothetical protein